jgi:NAD(P)-dependent dehydrogenase (short-subunit alcohol dehydrogenase family)
MSRLGAVISEAIVHHYGRDKLLRRLAHPFWFQSFGAVMGMDWHSSGITTSVIGALKRGLAPLEPGVRAPPRTALVIIQRSGKIITVSSVAGTAPSADGGYAHYGAAKAAIAHYTRYLAQDLGPFGITVNCIAPGVIATGRIMATVIPGSSQSNRDRAELVALRRLGTVDDCAKVVEFLATDLSDYVTGAVIPIDGGLVRG